MFYILPLLPLPLLLLLLLLLMMLFTCDRHLNAWYVIVQNNSHYDHCKMSYSARHTFNKQKIKNEASKGKWCWKGKKYWKKKKKKMKKKKKKEILPWQPYSAIAEKESTDSLKKKKTKKKRDYSVHSSNINIICSRTRFKFCVDQTLVETNFIHFLFLKAGKFWVTVTNNNFIRQKTKKNFCPPGIGMLSSGRGLFIHAYFLTVLFEVFWPLKSRTWSITV